MDITVACPVHPSYRVHQIAGMFDVPLVNPNGLPLDLRQTFAFEMPPLDTDWQIGCIVGPSGSGKSTIAKEIFRNNYAAGGTWKPHTAVIDNFGNAPIKSVTKMLTAVGFSSPPSWIKPYAVLSNGEKFRCDLAQALLTSGQLPVGSDQPQAETQKLPTDHRPLTTVVFDEYTSVVDRNVAKIASAAIAKGIKSGAIPVRFAAVTCHYDILDWLEPDWVLDTATGKCTVAIRKCSAAELPVEERRLLRRPSLHFDIYRCRYDLWQMFKKHHYLSGKLSKASRCYCAVLNSFQLPGSNSQSQAEFQPQRIEPENGKLATGNWQLTTRTPVAFCALLPQQGLKNWYRVSRLVTLPDYQGIGIGSALLEALGNLYTEQDYRFSITASHPSVIAHCKRSPHWRTAAVKQIGSKRSAGRAVVSFEFCR